MAQISRQIRLNAVDLGEVASARSSRFFHNARDKQGLLGACHSAIGYQLTKVITVPEQNSRKPRFYGAILNKWLGPISRKTFRFTITL